MARLGWDCAQGRTYLQIALRRKSEVVLFSVKLPPQDCLRFRPGGVSLPQLLCGYGLLLEAVGVGVRTEERVNAPKEVEENLLSFRGASLAGGYGVVQVYVYLGQGVSQQIDGGLRLLSIVVRLGPPLVGGLGGN